MWERAPFILAVGGQAPSGFKLRIWREIWLKVLHVMFGSGVPNARKTVMGRGCKIEQGECTIESRSIYVNQLNRFDWRCLFTAMPYRREKLSVGLLELVCSYGQVYANIAGSLWKYVNSSYTPNFGASLGYI